MRKTLFLSLFAGAFYIFSHTQLPAVDRSVSLPEVYDQQFSVAAVKLSERKSDKSMLTRDNFDDVVRDLYDVIGLADYNLGFDIFRKAMIGYYTLEKQGSLENEGLLTIINFEQPSTEKRFYTIDLIKNSVKYHTYVAHGRNTGQNRATTFSNIPHSNQSSLGFYVTAETYYGSKGYSLRLDGKERKFNDKIRSRAVVMHGADYVSEKWIRRYGRLGRSQGCPALPMDINKEVINTIKGGSVIFIYYPEKNYLKTSEYLEAETLFELLDENPIEIAASQLSS